MAGEHGKRHDVRAMYVRIIRKSFLMSCIPSLLGPFRVATYHFACLRSTAQSNVWVNIEDGHMGTFNKIG